MPIRRTLHAPDIPIETVYFHETGWASMLAVLEDGSGAEVGLVGFEGMVGLPVILGGETDELEALVQAPGTAYSMGAEALSQAMEEDAVLRRLLLRFALAFHSQAARTGACNGRHNTEQRLARWLLMAHDRVEGDEFPMTHEFLAMMLGVRRAGVTVAAGALQKAQLVGYERGRVRILNRRGLEATACECYGVTRRAYERLLGGGGPRGCR
ncbi:Crp/Fnr family transcriptional regulator [Pseudoroseomonas rhizosphaerae]|uniref:Crp/Fnr family transcriptional regulator n=2 Tax=Teichococcus rhizosphaerae TaxID=1335062 RepID=A0A2C7A5I1_9PROT|nr:Crp/Fnr family transcriptional regulator [Pseudoroseomonas rhizosphaerae]